MVNVPFDVSSYIIDIMVKDARSVRYLHALQSMRILWRPVRRLLLRRPIDDDASFTSIGPTHYHRVRFPMTVMDIHMSRFSASLIHLRTCGPIQPLVSGRRISAVTYFSNVVQ